MTHEEQLRNLTEQLQAMSAQLDNDQNPASPAFDNMKNSVRNFLQLIQNVQQTPYALRSKERSSIRSMFQTMSEYTDHYAESHHGIRGTTNGALRRDQSDSLLSLFKKMQPFVEDHAYALELADNYCRSYDNGEEDRQITKLDDLFTSSKIRVTPSDCFTLRNYEKPDFASPAVFGRLVYLARQEAALHPDSLRPADPEAQFDNPGVQAAIPGVQPINPNVQAVQQQPAIPEEAPTIYQDTFRHLTQQLTNASFTDQMRFAVQLERYRTSLLDRLADSLTRFRNETEEAKATGKTDVLNPLVRLYADPDYRKLESLNLLENKLGMEAKKFSEHFRITNSYLGRPSVIALQEYMPGNEKHFLKADQIAQGEKLRKEADRHTLAESSYAEYKFHLQADDAEELDQPEQQPAFNEQVGQPDQQPAFNEQVDQPDQQANADEKINLPEQQNVPNEQIDPQIAPNEQLNPQIDPNDQINPQIAPNDQINPLIDPDVQMDPQIFRDLQMAEQEQQIAPDMQINEPNQPIAPAAQINRQPPQPDPAKHIDIDLRPLFDVYSNMMSDKNDASPYYRSMRERLGNFLSLNHAEISDTTTYEANLSLAMQAAQIYLDTHKGYIAHSYGQNRRSWAETALAALTQIHTVLTDDMKAKRITLDSKTDAAKEEQQAELEKLGLLQHLTSASFVPTPRRTDFAPSRMSNFIGGTLHAISNVIAGAASIISAPFWGLNRWKHRKDTFVEETHDYERIPGLDTRERFLKFDPDKASPNQPILSDNRRIPCVWEQKSTGDPNQPPTITINSQQSKAGKVNATSGLFDEAGHAFLTLEYTKNDPITGEPQRYKTSFGFHPRKALLGTGNSLASFATMGGKGGLVPGQLEDDSAMHAHASITYTANNRQINKILLAAQGYAKDGYNMINRNCVNFVKDMTDIAGLDTSGLFHEVDFELGPYKAAGTAVSLLVTDYFRMYGNHALVKSQGQTVGDDYQLLGQQQISEEEVKHYTKAKALNFRLRGYNPSRLAEAIKATGKGNLAISDTKSEDENAVSFPSDARIEPVFNNQYTEMSPALYKEVVNFCLKKKLSLEERNRIGVSLKQILHDYYLSIDSNLIDGFAEKPGPNQTASDYYHTRKNGLTQCSKSITELQDKLNQFYKTVLHSEPELYIPFQHMSSLFTDVKVVVDNELTNLDQTFAIKVVDLNRKEKNPIKNDLLTEVDSSLENADALRKFRFGMTSIENFDVSFLQVAAMSLIYKDDMDFRDDMQFYRSKINQNPDEMEENDRKRFQEIQQRNNLSLSMTASMSYYAGTPSYTRGDLDFIFIKLPHFEEKNGLHGVADTFQGFVWNKALPPTRKQISAIVNTIVTNPKGAKDQEELFHNISTDITKLLAESLSYNKAAISQILRSMHRSQDHYALPEGHNFSSNDVDYTRTMIKKSLANNITSSLFGTRIDEQITDALRSTLSKNNLSDQQIDVLAKNLKSNVSLEFQNLLNRVLNPNVPDNPGNEMAPRPDGLDAYVKNLSWMKDELDAMPGFTAALEAMTPALAENERHLQTLANKQNLNGEETIRKNGLQKMLDSGKDALKSLTDNASLGRNSFNNKEKEDILLNLSQVSFILFMNKLNNANRMKVFTKMSRDPGAYDRYIKRIAESKAFRESLKDLDPNSLASGKGMRDFMSSCDRIFSREFYKQVHVSGIRQMAGNRGPEPIH